MRISTTNDLTRALILHVCRTYPGARAWRRNVGQGYPAAVVKTALGALRRNDVAAAIQTLVRARPVMFGVPGEPDIDGWVRINHTAVRLGIEVKTGQDRMRTKQLTFQSAITRGGGIYVVAHTFEQATADLQTAIDARLHP